MTRLHAAAALTLVAACATPEPPKLEPKRAEVKKVAVGGLDVELTLLAKNPNAFALRAKKVTARVELADSVDLGEVTVDADVKLPAKKTTRMVVSMSISWRDLGSVAALAATRTEVPFSVEGTAEVGTDDVRFDVPFRTTGTLTRDQIVSLGVGAVPIPTSLPKLPF